MRGLLSAHWLKSDARLDEDYSEDTMKISHYSYQVYYAYIRYLYTGEVDLDVSDLFDLYELAHCYMEEDLQEYCSWIMSSNMSSATWVDMYKLASSFDDLELLKQQLTRFFTRNRFSITQTSSFKALDNDIRQKLNILGFE